MKNKISTTIKMYPFTSAITNDMILFVPIDTLFLTVVKGLDVIQISLISTISMITCIILQQAILKIVKRIGNCNSFRLGIILLLVACCILISGKSFVMLILYKIFFEFAFMFLGMDKVILKNNLYYLNKESDYYKIRNNTKILYSFLTMIAALISGVIFNYNHYLPLYIQMSIFIVMIFISFIMCEAPNDNIKTNKKAKVGLKANKVMLMLLIFNAISIAIIKNGQNNSKLFIQYDFQDLLPVEKVTYIITIIVFLSRIARLVGNYTLGKAYLKVSDNLAIILSGLLCIAFLLLIVGHFVPTITGKIITMSIGFFLILGTRDSFQVYIEDTSLKLCNQENQQQTMINIEIYRKLGSLLLSILCTLILTNHTLLVIEFVLFGFALINIVIGFLLLRTLKNKCD